MTFSDLMETQSTLQRQMCRLVNNLGIYWRLEMSKNDLGRAISHRYLIFLQVKTLWSHLIHTLVNVTEYIVSETGGQLLAWLDGLKDGLGTFNILLPHVPLKLPTYIVICLLVHRNNTLAVCFCAGHSGVVVFSFSTSWLQFERSWFLKQTSYRPRYLSTWSLQYGHQEDLHLRAKHVKIFLFALEVKNCKTVTNWWNTVINIP